jgi:hypothetical protein
MLQASFFGGGAQMSHNDSNTEGNEVLLGILGVLALMATIVFRETAGRAGYLHEQWSDPEHPKHGWIVPFFGMPVVLVIVSILIMFADPLTGLLGLLLTGIGFWATVSVVAFFSAPTVERPVPTLQLDNLDTYLEPFDLDAPVQTHTQPVAVVSAQPRRGLLSEIGIRVLKSDMLPDTPEFEQARALLRAEEQAQSDDAPSAHPNLDRLEQIGKRMLAIEDLKNKPGMEGEDALVAFLQGKSSAKEDPLESLRALLRK